MKATRFMRRPFIVAGFQVDVDNMDAIARWCEGYVIRDVAQPFIQVPVIRPTSRKQTEAFPTMWVILSRGPVKGEKRFKVYTDEWVHRDFIIFDDFAYNDEGLEEEELAPPCCPHQHGGSNNVRALPTQNNGSHAVPFRVGR